MPIRDFHKDSDGVATIGERLGTLYKGARKGKSQNGKPISGRDLTYFRVRFPLEDRQELDKAQQQRLDNMRVVFEQFYGKQPARFEDVSLCASTPDDVFQYWFEKWRGNNQLDRRCDGVSVTKQWTREGYSRDQVPCMCRALDVPECKATGRIAVILNQFSNATGLTGFFLISTHSAEEIKRIRVTLEWAYSQFGDLSRLPFVLERQPENLPFVGKDKNTGEAVPASSEHWMIYLSLHPLFLQRYGNQSMLADITRAALPAPAQTALPPAPAQPKRDPEPAAPSDHPLSLSNVDLRAAFLTDARAELHLNPQQVLEKLGVKTLSSLDWHSAAARLGLSTMPPDPDDLNVDFGEDDK